MSLKIDDIVEKEVILEEGFESLMTFGNCLVFANDTTLVFWSPNTKRIRNICKREY